ncbi:hypothetical protein MEE_01123, partial [Bartonella elizabethae F9251 = ATCC 49927]
NDDQEPSSAYASIHRPLDMPTNSLNDDVPF